MREGLWADYVLLEFNIVNDDRLPLLLVVILIQNKDILHAKKHPHLFQHPNEITYDDDDDDKDDGEILNEDEEENVNKNKEDKINPRHNFHEGWPPAFIVTTEVGIILF